MIKTIQTTNQPFLCVDWWVQYAGVSPDVSSWVPLLSLKASPRPAAGAAYQVAQEVEQKHAEKPDDELSPCYVAATVPQYNYTRHNCHHTSKP